MAFRSIIIGVENFSVSVHTASKMMTALAQDGAINELSMSEAELERIYGPLQAQVSDSIHRQETILVNIEVSHVATANVQSFMNIFE